MSILSALAPTLITAGATLVGNAVSAITGHKENKKYRNTNFDMADLQHEQAIEKMQNQYQWAVNDMKKAGLNPALMYQSAASPSIAGGSGSGNMSGYNPGAGFANIGEQIASALSLKRMDSEIKKTDAETELINEQSGKTRADTLYTLQNTKLAKAQTMETIEKAGLTAQQKRNAKAELQKMYAEMEEISERINLLRNQGKIAEVQAQFAKADAIQRQITGYIESLTGAISAVKGTSALQTYSNSNANVNSTSNSNVVHWRGN